MEKYMQITRIQIDNKFKYALRIVDRQWQKENKTADYLSTTVLEILPKGLKVGVKYPIQRTKSTPDLGNIGKKFQENMIDDMFSDMDMNPYDNI